MLGESMKTPYLKFEKLCTLTNAVEKLAGCVSTDRNFLMTDADFFGRNPSYHLIEQATTLETVHLPPSSTKFSDGKYAGQKEGRRKRIRKAHHIPGIELVTSSLRSTNSTSVQQPFATDHTLLVYFFVSPWLY